MAKWYTYENNEVIGPFEANELESKVNPDSLVCRAGGEDWVKAGQVEELSKLFEDEQPQPPATEPEPAPPKDDTDVQGTESTQELPPEPTITKLRGICQQASDEKLAAEYNEHWGSYDRQERRIIRNEMVNRGIWKEVTEADEDEAEQGFMA